MTASEPLRSVGRRRSGRGPRCRTGGTASRGTDVPGAGGDCPRRGDRCYGSGRGGRAAWPRPGHPAQGAASRTVSAWPATAATSPSCCSRIYTRTGDDGTTALGDMSRAGQDRSPAGRVRRRGRGELRDRRWRIALGSLPADMVTAAARIQNELFDVGADLCNPVDGATRAYPPLRITEDYVSRLEQACDDLQRGLPALRSFVLPGGTPGAALLHMARTVVRRAERSAWAALEAHGDTVNPLPPSTSTGSPTCCSSWPGEANAGQRRRAVEAGRRSAEHPAVLAGLAQVRAGRDRAGRPPARPGSRSARPRPWRVPPSRPPPPPGTAPPRRPRPGWPLRRIGSRRRDSTVSVRRSKTSSGRSRTPKTWIPAQLVRLVGGHAEPPGYRPGRRRPHSTVPPPRSSRILRTAMPRGQQQRRGSGSQAKSQAASNASAPLTPALRAALVRTCSPAALSSAREYFDLGGLLLSRAAAWRPQRGVELAPGRRPVHLRCRARPPGRGPRPGRRPRRGIRCSPRPSTPLP